MKNVFGNTENPKYHHKLTLDRVSDVESFCNGAPDFHKIQMYTYTHTHTHAPYSVSSDLVRGGGHSGEDVILALL